MPIYVYICKEETVSIGGVHCKRKKNKMRTMKSINYWWPENKQLLSKAKENIEQSTEKVTVLNLVHFTRQFGQTAVED